jgi:hypothetical protein
MIVYSPATEWGEDNVDVSPYAMSGSDRADIYSYLVLGYGANQVHLGIRR